MKRSAPMKRTAFKPKAPPPRPVKTYEVHTPRARAPAVAISDGKARMVVPVPKRDYLRDKDYRRWVAAQNCAHCGVEGYSQAAHSDDNGAGGKGLALKACDSTIYPACGPRTGEPGCHWLIGTSGQYTKAERHALEATYSQATWAAWLAEKDSP